MSVLRLFPGCKKKIEDDETNKRKGSKQRKRGMV